MSGSTIYQHIYCEDIPIVKELHEQALRTPKEISLGPVRMKLKDGRFEAFNIKWKQFRNPWTGEIEYIVARYTPFKAQQVQQQLQQQQQLPQQPQQPHQLQQLPTVLAAAHQTSLSMNQQEAADASAGEANDANLIKYLMEDFNQQTNAAPVTLNHFRYTT